MQHRFPRKTTILITIQLLVLFFLLITLFHSRLETLSDKAESSTQNDYIHWVDFTIPSDVLKKAFRLDINSCTHEVHLDWIELLAWLGARYGGDFSRFKQQDLDSLAERLTSGESMSDITGDMKYYRYYHEAYTAVLGGMLGYFQQETADGWESRYGLKAFSPIAKAFPYSDYDDFGVSRSYGYKRQHLGHDMMGQVGTPIIAVESGYVEALGWNQYGGWRIGIRSFDQKRYYYYAHLRKDYPYQSNLEVGSIVTAGDVIGYMGRTGYSTVENTNNIDISHLHFGLQLIFDESQKDGDNQIWIDCHALTDFLKMNQCEVVKVDGTKEWTRVYQQKEE